MRVIDTDGRSFAAVIGAIVDNIQDLLRAEARLVTTEVREEVGRLAGPLGWLAFAAALAFYGVGLFLVVAVALLSRVVPLWTSAAIIGTIVTTLAVGLLHSGLRSWRRVHLAPKSIKENFTWNPPARHSRQESQQSATS